MSKGSTTQCPLNIPLARCMSTRGGGHWHSFRGRDFFTSFPIRSGSNLDRWSGQASTMSTNRISPRQSTRVQLYVNVVEPNSLRRPKLNCWLWCNVLLIHRRYYAKADPVSALFAFACVHDIVPTDVHDIVPTECSQFLHIVGWSASTSARKQKLGEFASLSDVFNHGVGISSRHLVRIFERALSK